MAGTDVRRVRVPPHAHPQRRAADLRRGGRGVRRPRAGRGAVGRAAGGGARGGRGAARRGASERGALEVNSHEPPFEFDADGHVTGVRHEAQTESHTLIEELMILANEQVAGYLADRKLPALYRVHEKPDPQSVEPMVAQLASLDIPTPALPRNMSPQQAADVAAEASRLAAAEARRSGRGRRLVRLAGAALAQAGLLHAAQPRPRRAGQRALLPLHLADPPLPRPGGAPRAAQRPGPGRRRAARARARRGRASRPARASARR